MKRLVLSLLLSLVASGASAQGYLPIATWLNDPAHARDGDRLTALLHARGIEAVTTCSAGCTLSVSNARFGEALQIVEEAALREHLDVDIVSLPTS